MADKRKHRFCPANAGGYRLDSRFRGNDGPMERE